MIVLWRRSAPRALAHATLALWAVALATGCSGSRGDGLSATLNPATSDEAGLDGGSEADACTDGDGDGFGEGCSAGPDCDDADPALHRGVKGFRDDDGDGFGLEPAEVCADGDGQPPKGFALSDGDCDDTRKDVNPDVDVDGCDDIDTDCDDAIDEDRVPVTTQCGVGACANTGESRCSDDGAIDNCVPGSALGAADATCDGVDDDCDGKADEDYPVEATSCQNGACAASGQRICSDGTPLDTCKARVPSTSDSTCDGVDDDCDGRVDEDFGPQSTACGRGECVAGGTTRCEAGAVVDSCAPRQAAATDATCDRRDDDCDGQTDEDYASTTTQCGAGACLKSGSTSCLNGTVVDSCKAGTGGGGDATCDGVDDNCNGQVDEGYTGHAESCGVGACARSTQTRCSGGREVSTCSAGSPTSDANCNGIDEDCNGQADEDYAGHPVSCGVGACARTGTSRCVGAAEQSDCTPGAPAAADNDCDGIDDNCNGRADEGYVPTATRCGVGACSASGSLQCVAGRLIDSCSQGAAGNDTICDGIDNDCNGQVDEDYVPRPDTCGVGACRRTVQTSCSGGRELTCTPGPSTGADDDCDGIDDDCNGVVDDKYQGRATSCGVGACAARGVTSCVGGVEQNSCRPGSAAAIDNTCDNVDDDCNGQVDEDYRVTVRCGVGACLRDGVETCSAGRTVQSCTPGAPAASDATCNAIDDDCNGQLDEDYAGRATSCGVGGCARRGSTMCSNGHEVDSCTPGAPAGSDATCNAIDDDCNGVVDDGFRSTATSCGVGECASTGSTRCAQGAIVDSCVPRAAPAANDALCNGRDDDCNGQVDEDYTSRATTCSLAQCGARGATSCVSGREVDSCVTPIDSCDASSLSCANGQACGRTRCTGQACGCTALSCTTGQSQCQNGLLCSGTDQCGVACNCVTPGCKRGTTIVKYDDKYVYYGTDECGALCAPMPRCDHAKPVCGTSQKEECGIDLATGAQCECTALVCRDKATCLKNVLCGSDACGNRCGTCVDSCGSAAVCSRDNAQTCPATCDGALCSDKCTPCAKGCNVKTGACF